MAVLGVGEWHFVQELPFAYTNGLGGNTAVMEAWYHLGRHGGGLGVTLELILASGRVQRGVPPVGSWAHLSEGMGGGRGGPDPPRSGLFASSYGEGPPSP